MCMDPTRIVLLAALAAVLCGAVAVCGAVFAVRAARRGTKRGDGAVVVSGHPHHDFADGDGGGDGD